MGLDAVEIVLRVEEFFSVSISDKEAGSIATVGDLYNTVCLKLNIAPLERPVTVLPLPVISIKEKGRWFGYRLKSLPPPCEVLPFTSLSVWNCVVAIFVDQMLLEPEEVLYAAHINGDLGID